MNHYLDNSMDWISWENLRRKLGNSPSDVGANIASPVHFPWTNPVKYGKSQASIHAQL